MVECDVELGAPWGSDALFYFVGTHTRPTVRFTAEPVGGGPGGRCYGLPNPGTMAWYQGGKGVNWVRCVCLCSDIGMHAHIHAQYSGFICPCAI